MIQELNYLVYEGGYLIAGFVSLFGAKAFIEETHSNPVPMELVYAPTAEVIDIWTNGSWDED